MLPKKRREFFRTSTLIGLSALCPQSWGGMLSNDLDQFPEKTRRFVREARYYEKLDNKQIRCTLCPRECVIDDRERGYCGVRENREGSYYTLVYGRPCTTHVDPIEKKPLFHFLPGSRSYSLATAGCNLNCKFCQNWQISQVRPEDVRSLDLPPKETAAQSRATGCSSIAFTYSEPTIFFEYMLDTAIAARALDIRSVVVTAAYIAKEPLIELCKQVDGIKVDLKAFSESYYKDIVNGELRPVLDSLITMRKMGVWTEIVYLVLPGLNDSDKELKELAHWIHSELGPDVPLHFSRFYPQYRLRNLPPTPQSTLERAKQIADAEGLHFVYLGNVPGHPANSTYCPGCDRTLIGRIGYNILENNLLQGNCKHCGTPIPGIWK